jgi:hypothetical protein
MRNTIGDYTIDSWNGCHRIIYYLNNKIYVGSICIQETVHQDHDNNTLQRYNFIMVQSVTYKEDHINFLQSIKSFLKQMPEVKYGFKYDEKHTSLEEIKSIINKAVNKLEKIQIFL